jgi:hypothetical protein
MLALRELAQGGFLGSRVVPVLEPIKLSPTFNGTVNLFTDMGQPLALILNPAVGYLSGNSAAQAVLPFISGSVVPSLIIDKNTIKIIDEIYKKFISNKDILAIMTNRDYIDNYRSIFDAMPPKFTMLPDERLIRSTIIENKVMFEDKFKKQEKNTDYLKEEDEFFSDDHLYFKDEGFVGFGDYSILGDEYADSGFAPYAVAIHIVYFAEDNTLRVRHFVSDSNMDTSDVAGKYQEALQKLKKWYDTGQSRQLTSALSTLLNHTHGYYPGLLTVKKLSIMHHFELMGRYLDGGLA